jgi:hypothetical protein
MLQSQALGVGLGKERVCAEGRCHNGLVFGCLGRQCGPAAGRQFGVQEANRGMYPA